MLLHQQYITPFTPWSRKHQLIKNQKLTFSTVASIPINLFILTQTCHSHSYGCPLGWRWRTLSKVAAVLN
jgi:hypothetical protein